MKKQLLLFLTAFLPMMASADASGTCGDYLTWTYIEATHTLTISGEGNMENYSYSSNAPWYSYRSNMTKVIIEDGVTDIGQYAFTGCSALTSITIPNNVTTIGQYSFVGCSSLTSVTIGNSVTNIGGYAFRFCSSLTSITIPNSVTTIGSNAFEGCSDLTSITIGNSVKSIGDNAFKNCSAIASVTFLCSEVNAWFGGYKSIKEITIGDEVTSIGDAAFLGCSSLTSATIGNSVTSIGKSAFANCSGLTSITLSNGVTSIGGYAFDGCNNLISITIPNSVTSIGDYAFCQCSGLTSIMIPNSVTSIGDGTFVGCSGLVSITIPNSVTTIGASAFYNCSNLKSITIPNSVAFIGYDAFYGTAWYNNQPNGLVYAGKVAYKYKGTMPNNTKIVLEDGTLSIGKNAFYDCSGLTSITIPNSVTNIGARAFEGCKNLASVSIGSGIKVVGYAAFYLCSNITAFHINNLTSWCMVSFEYKGEGRTFYSSNPFDYGTIEHLYINGEEVTDLVIPYGVTRLNRRAFYNLKSLTSITVPNTLTTIGSEAFEGCSGLTSITIPNSVTNIGSGAFQGCNNLLTVNSEITEPFNCSGAFSENTLRKGTLYIPAGTKDLYTRFDGWREFLKIEEVGGAPEESVWLTLKDCQGASKLKLKKGVEQELVITPEEGWKLLTVAMDGTDVTAQISNDGSFTTPAIMQDAVITIVYEQEVPSEVAGARQSKANVKVVDDGVIITNAEPDTRCVVYRSNGQKVTSAIVDDGSRKITLQKGQVYILTIGDRTLKFAL